MHALSPRAAFCTIMACATMVQAAPKAADIAEPPLTWEQQTRLRNVAVDGYLVAINSIKSVEFDYEYASPTVNGPGRPHQARYVRDGERFRHTEGVLERLWDGKHAYYPLNAKQVRRSTSPRLAITPYPVPESALNLSLERAYGIFQEDDSGLERVYSDNPAAETRTYAFLGAAEVQHEGRDCIVLRLISRDERFIMTTLHCREFSYWPVSIRVARHNGLSGWEIADIKYHEKVEPDGTKVYFPLSFEKRHWAPRGKTRGFYRIDPKTLRVNEPIDPARFKLNLKPTDEFVLDDGRTVTVANATAPSTQPSK